MLVAIAIPVFTTQLAKSRAATDLANIRSGYAAVQTTILTDAPTADTTYTLNKDGSVVNGTGGDYKCKGASADADSGAAIGKFTPAATAGTDTIVWTKDQGITYSVKDVNGSAAISGIAGND